MDFRRGVVVRPCRRILSIDSGTGRSGDDVHGGL